MGQPIRLKAWYPDGKRQGANPENWNILVPGGKENNLVIPQVVAIERGKAQTIVVSAIMGLKDLNIC